MRTCVEKSLCLKERKRTKKKETKGRGSLWKLPQPSKSIKVAFGNIFLVIYSVAWKTLLGFPQLLTSPAAINV
jgi:hypothetical protein